MDAPLFLLHLRRSLHPGLALVLVGTGLLVVLGAPQGARDVLRAGIDSQALERGLRRADLALALGLVLAPVLAAAAVRSQRAIESGERLWLLTRPVSRARVAVSSWAGALAGACLWLALLGLAVEAWAAGGGATWRPAGELEIVEPERRGAAGVLGWTSPTASPRPDGARARLSANLLGSYNEVEAFELRVVDAAGAGRASGPVQPAARTVVEVDLPAGAAPLSFELEAMGAERSLALRGARLELFLPATERGGTWGLALRAALVLGALLSLGMGLGAWLRPASVLLLLLGGYALVWLETDRLDGTLLARWLPGYDLPRALALVGEGRAPAELGIAPWLGAALLVTLGHCLQRISLGRWRSGP